MRNVKEVRPREKDLYLTCLLRTNDIKNVRRSTLYPCHFTKVDVGNKKVKTSSELSGRTGPDFVLTF